ncbi:GbNV_gp74-like [Fopius arisanus]|nr:GbNV_gp74-like [Fopius arisanus]
MRERRENAREMVDLCLSVILQQLNMIEGRTIADLRDTLPSPLYRKLYLKAIAPFYGIETINLEFLYNTLPSRIFNREMKKWLDEILNTNEMDFDLPGVRKFTVRQTFIRFLQDFLKTQHGWDKYMNECTDILEEHLMTAITLDSELLSEEHYLLLMNLPARLPKFADETYNCIAIEQWRIVGDSTNYCRFCAEEFSNNSDKRRGKYIHIEIVSGEDLVKNIIWNEKYWCSICIRRPLFYLIDKFAGYYDQHLL